MPSEKHAIPGMTVEANRLSRTPVKIAPSLLAADFSRLAEEVRRVERAGADALHVDVMDGHFVPNITLGPVVLEGIRPHTSLPFDVHLMITHPAKYIEPFAKAGADRLYFHVEVPDAGPDIIRRLRELNVEPGVSVSPDTDLDSLKPFYEHVAGILVMTVYPGFGGQTFLPGSCERIAAIARDARECGASPDISVDGGINSRTVALAADAGANMIVAGTAIFRAADPAAAIRALRDAACAGNVASSGETEP